MRTAFTASRHQIVGEAAGVEEVDIRRAVQVPVVRRIDKIAVSVWMWANKRLEHRAYGRIEDRCDVMAPTKLTRTKAWSSRSLPRSSSACRATTWRSLGLGSLWRLMNSSASSDRILDTTDATDEMSGVQSPGFPWSGIPRIRSFAYWRAANRKPILYLD